MKYRLAFGLMIAMSSMTGWSISCSAQPQSRLLFAQGNTYPRNIQGVDLSWGAGLSNRDGQPISGWTNLGSRPSSLDSVDAFTSSSYYSCIGRCRGVGIYHGSPVGPKGCSSEFQQTTTTDINGTMWGQSTVNSTLWGNPTQTTTTSVGDASTNVRDLCFTSCQNNLSSGNWSGAGIFDSNSTISGDQIMQYYKDNMVKPNGVDVL